MIFLPRLKVLWRYFDDHDLREALKLAHPGVFDRRSWAHWHLVLNVDPVPPRPRRQL